MKKVQKNKRQHKRVVRIKGWKVDTGLLDPFLKTHGNIFLQKGVQRAHAYWCSECDTIYFTKREAQKQCIIQG